MSGRRLQYLTIIGGDLLMLVIGITTCWSSLFLNQLPTNIVATERNITWCIYIPIVGYLAGALISSLFLDVSGRKLFILAEVPIIFTTSIILALAENIYLMGLARLMMGFITGTLTTTLPIYYGEIVNTKIRGAAAGSVIFSQYLGLILISTTENYNIAIDRSNILYTIVLLAIGSSLLFFASESPYYLIKTKDFLGARQAIMRLSTTANTNYELSKITEAVKSPEAAYLEIFRSKTYRREMFIYTIMSVTINIVATTSVIGILGLIFMLLGLSMVDKSGRRSLFIVSCSGCTVISTIQAFYYTFEYFKVDFITHVSWIPQATVILFGIFFSFGLLYASEVLLSEIFSPAIKVKACGIANAIHMLLSLLALLIYKQIELASATYLPIWIYSLLSALGIFLIYNFLPEMKGKSLEVVQSDFVGKSIDLP